MKLRNKLAAILDAAFLIVACLALALYVCTEHDRQESLVREDCRQAGGQWVVMDDGDTSGYGCEE